MTKIVMGGRAATKGQMLKIIQDQRGTIEALKASLQRRRNPEASVLERATVEELMGELESRPRAEVDAFLRANKAPEPSPIVLPPGVRLQ